MGEREREVGERIYFKIPAFGETLFLNLSLSSSEGYERTLIEYVRRNGSIVETKSPSSHHHQCHYTGVVHQAQGSPEGEELGAVLEGTWAAVSTCSGLVSTPCWCILRSMCSELLGIDKENW